MHSQNFTKRGMYITSEVEDQKDRGTVLSVTLFTVRKVLSQGSKVALLQWWVRVVQSGREEGRNMVSQFSGVREVLLNGFLLVTQCAGGTADTTGQMCSALGAYVHFLLCLLKWNHWVSKMGIGGNYNRTRTLQQWTLVPANPVSVGSFFFADNGPQETFLCLSCSKEWVSDPVMSNEAQTDSTGSCQRSSLLCCLDSNMVPLSLIYPLPRPTFFFGGWGRGKNIRQEGAFE